MTKKYSNLDKYNLKCPDGYHYNPGHKKSDKNGCLKNSFISKENFGSFSISAALKDPIIYNNNTYLDGVS